MIMNKNSFRKNIILTTLIVSVASLIAGSMMVTSTHAENVKTIYDETVLAAEIEFAETITQAKRNYHELREIIQGGENNA